MNSGDADNELFEHLTLPRGQQKGEKEDFPGVKSIEQLVAAHLKMNPHRNTYSEVF